MHGHLAYASSWQTDIVESMMKDEGLVKVTADQCQYGCADSDMTCEEADKLHDGRSRTLQGIEQPLQWQERQMQSPKEGDPHPVPREDRPNGSDISLQIT